MAIAVAATREALALAYGAEGNFISLHTADPGTTGANEATGGGYARQATTWSGGAVDGVIAGTQVEVPVPAGTFTHVGIFDAVTAGNFVDSYAIPGGVTLSVIGTVKVTPTFTES